MKKICKSVAVFAIMAGLLCATSYAKSLKDVLGSTKLGEKLQQNEKLNKASSQKAGGNVLSGGQVDSLDSSSWWNRNNDYMSKGEWEGIEFNNDGTCTCWNGGAKGLNGKWTGGLKNGEKVSVTADGKTQSGTVTKKGATLAVTLGSWGTFEKE